MTLDEMLGDAERFANKAAAAGADQAECYLEASKELSLDLEKGVVSAVETSQETGGAIRVVKAGALGFAYFAQYDQAPAAIEAALSAAARAPRKGYTLPAGDHIEAMPGRWDDRYAALSVDETLQLAKDATQGCKEGAPDAIIGGGGVGLQTELVAIASTEGVAAQDRATMASVGVSLLLEDGTRTLSTWDSAVVHAGRLDSHRLGLETGERILSLRDPEPLPQGGKLDLVLLPHCADLVTDLAIAAADGDDAMRGKTVWSKKRGEQVAPDHLDLLDASRDPAGIGAVATDAEGMVTRDLSIIENGRLASFLFDARTAQDHSQTSTASAIRSGFKTPPSTGTHHVRLDSRNAVTMDKLLAEIDNGLLVESMLGAHTANATTGEFSVTAPNVWHIRSGELAGASAEVAIQGQLDDWLGNLDATSDTPRHMPGLSVPALRVRDASVSV